MAASESLRRVSTSLCVDPADEALRVMVTRDQVLDWIEEQSWCLVDGDPLIAYLHEVSDYGDYITSLRGERVVLKPAPKKVPWWRFWK